MRLMLAGMWCLLLHRSSRNVFRLIHGKYACRKCGLIWPAWIALLVMCTVAHPPAAQAASWRGAWRWTEAALLAGRAADVRSSWGAQETNPLLGRGAYGARQAALELTGAAASLAAQEWAVRRSPAQAKKFVLINLGTAIVFGGVAARNEERVK